MAKKKLFEDIRLNPQRFYRAPGDVLRDRRFNDSERLEILRAWRDAEPETAGLGAMVAELESRLASGHAAE
jgi:hypothetical protein